MLSLWEPSQCRNYDIHDYVIKWKHFPRYWPFVRRILWWLVNSPHNGQWRGALMFSLIYALNKRLCKQSWGWWFETPSPSLWRHWWKRAETALFIEWSMRCKHSDAEAYLHTMVIGLGSSMSWPSCQEWISRSICSRWPGHDGTVS